MQKLAVIGIGGNSIIRDEHHQRVSDQYEAIRETAVHLAGLVEGGYDIVITHGNGPQVGFILRRSEIAYKHEGLHNVPLVSCVADTQGALGYQIQQALGNEFRKRGIRKEVLSLITQVKVNPDDPTFRHPSKPIGTFYPEEQIAGLQRDHPGWSLVQDAGRGFRRVVPSPEPLEIVELAAIKTLVRAGYTVIAAGGGGIPVIGTDHNTLEGVDAVVDKDLVSALLASGLEAGLLVFSTAVEQVYLNFGKADQRALQRVSISQLKEYMAQGHFAAGSMLPKIKASLKFLEGGGKEAIITSPEYLKEAIEGRRGTRIGF